MSDGLKARTLRLSELLGCPATAQDGQRLGDVKDAIVRLTLQHARPAVTGIVIAIGGRDLFVPLAEVQDLAAPTVRLSTARLDLRPFERRDGEVLLKDDLLGHRLIDVAAVQLVRARDVELALRDGDGPGPTWVVNRVDLSTRRRLRAFWKRSRPRAYRDWADVEPLIGHLASARWRAPFSRLNLFRPAQIADLVEEADPGESDEILDAVGGDPALEAEVIEELETERQAEVLAERSDDEVAEVLRHMAPDDAADLVIDLPQERRTQVLGRLPTSTEDRIRTLMSFSATTAGGLMTPDLLYLPGDTPVATALEKVAAATAIPPEALLVVYIHDDAGCLSGTVALPALLQADRALLLSDIAEANPVRVLGSAGVREVAVQMTDYNLVAIPVVEVDDRLLGVVTVDDVLEATMPEDWWERSGEPPEAPRLTRRHRPGRPDPAELLGP